MIKSCISIKLPLLFLISAFFFLSACANSDKAAIDGAAPNTQFKSLLTGFNINWSFLPPLNQDIINVTASLKPQIIRYPGGTISKKWNWQDGTTINQPNRPAHPLNDLLELKKATGAEVIFVLNTIYKTLDDQLSMLRTARDMGIPVKYIEMGNEHYLGKGNNADDSGKHQDNVDKFPTGKEYAEFVNGWVPEIRAEFPDVKIGISMLGRTNNNERLKTWNQLIVDTIEPDNFDAFVYHVYVRPENTIELNETTIPQIIKSRTDVLESVMIDDNSKEVWITEYGVHADTAEKTVTLTSALADYIESIADISMPQVLYTKSESSFFSFLTPPDANKLTALGKMFANRSQSK